MTEYDDEWFNFYENGGGRPQYKVGNTLRPTSSHTGCGIIIQTAPCLKILTDFGNIFEISEKGVAYCYEVTGIDRDIKSRLGDQISKLNDVLEEINYE